MNLHRNPMHVNSHVNSVPIKSKAYKNTEAMKNYWNLINRNRNLLLKSIGTLLKLIGTV